MTVVGTNLGAIVARDNMAKFSAEMDKAIERLSSGSRINSASDDAAGMAIVSKMTAQVNGLNGAIKNSVDAQKLIDTTEGAHVEITNILQRLRELAVQSSNDTNDALDRSFIKSESTALIAEIDRITLQTTWNGFNIMNGDFSSKQFQVGANANEDIQVSVDTTASASIGNYQANGETGVYTGAADTIAAHTLTVSGFNGSAVATVAANGSAEDAASAINALTASTGVTASALTTAKFGTMSATGTVTFNIGSATASKEAAISVAVTAVSDLRGIRDAINAVAGTTGITAEMSSGTNASMVLTHQSGADIMISDFLIGDSAATMKLAGFDTDGTVTTSSGGTEVTLQSTAGANEFDDAVVNGHLQLNSHKTFSVTSSNTTTEQGFFDTTATSTAAISAVSAINVGTSAGAEAAITAIDGALTGINAARAELGAVSNRLDSTVSNLTNIVANTDASISNIKDADFALETSNMTKAQILNQAATSMLAQANASKQSILSLLQG
jgi:flagellin